MATSTARLVRHLENLLPLIAPDEQKHCLEVETCMLIYYLGKSLTSLTVWNASEPVNTSETQRYKYEGFVCVKAHQSS